jgi:putative oxidoreductase
MDIGVLILRLTVGLTLSAHGAQKLFGWFGGPGLDKTGQMFQGLGFLPGRRHALMAGVVEIVSGLLLALGLLTPLGAAMVFSVMVVAAVSVHMKNGFFITSGGFEYTLVLGIAGLTVAFTGPGALSLDALLGLPTVHSGVLSGVAALVVGLIGGFGQVAQQQRPAPAMQAVSAK